MYTMLCISTYAPHTHAQIYTESANLRHCPEALFFFFWCLAMSRPFEVLWGAGLPAGVQEHARDRRLAMRNVLQVSQQVATQ